MNDIFQQNKHAQLYIYKWMEQNQGLVAGFTTRLNGHSEGVYTSNNMGLHVQDQTQAVIYNRSQLCEQLGFPFESFTCAEQVHGDEVEFVEQIDKGKGRLSVEDTILGADGIVTATKGVLLTSFYADCVPLLFLDPVTKTVALAHAGWKGTVGAIAKQTIHKMVSAGSELSHIQVAIGPSIDQCCYEVNHVVIDAIHRLWKQEQLPTEALNACIKPINEQKSYINLKEINRQIMIKAGILSSHIEISMLCTSCRTDLFFSHRKEQGKTGRMASFIGWRERDSYDS